MKYLFSILCIVTSMFFSSCLSSTTSAGAVGADRGQLLIISEAQMEESANASYAQVLSEAEKAGTLNSDKATTERVRKIAEKLIAQTTVFRTDALNWNWQVNVISDSTVNAWCMPGGKIVVYTGIIQTLKMTDGELAAVMGHEISHALKEHSREQASQTTLVNIGIDVASQAAGFGATGTNLLGLAAQYAITLPFSRSHETEADHMGTELMARAGYDPYEAVTLWNKMLQASSSNTPEILSTHPSHETRIQDLNDIAKQVYPLYQATLK